MTHYQPVLIANYRTALERDISSWILPQDGYPTLNNSFEYRGRIYKKGGSNILGRLGVRSETLVAARGAGATNVALNLAYVPIEPGSIVISDGTTTFTDDGTGGFVVTPLPGDGTVNAPTNYVTGAINITFNNANIGAPITANYIIVVNNNSPVMGLLQREIPNTNEESLVAFDLTAAYEYSNTLMSFQHLRNYKGTTNEVSWTGTNSDFFWGYNYQNALFVTNNVPGGHFYTITGITNAAAAQVTTSVANNFAAGDVVYFNNVQGMIAAGDSVMNNFQGVVTIAGNPFTVAINTAAATAYGGGGVAWSQTLSKAAAGDGIRWYDGTGWVNFEPPLDPPTVPAPRILQGALLIVAYKDHFIFLNTVEGTTSAGGTRFAQRARYSQIGNIYYAPPVPAGITAVPTGQEWLETPGRGGFVDATTSEEIISCEFIKDTLIVFFERSTWRLTFTGNIALPFVWEKVNSEIGSESTFSTVPFDREILTVGPNGIWGCDSINLVRIDEKIPDEVFGFQNDEQGVKRVHGIRDYYNQFVYWTYVDPNYDLNGQNPVFPNSVLAYNYKDSAWSIFRSYYTCFGYYQRVDDLTWGTATNAWGSYNIPWSSPSLQSGFPFVVAGNQQGFVVEYQEVDAQDTPTVNSLNYVVQDISAANPSVITSPNHNFDENTFLIFEDVGGIPAFDDIVFRVSPLANITQNTFTLIDSSGNPVSMAGYTFGGQIRVVDNFEVVTKKFNPFIETGQKVRIGYADMFFETTVEGSITAELYGDEDNDNPLSIQTINLQDPSNAVTSKFWTRVYFNVVAQTVSIKLTLTSDDDGQIFDHEIAGEAVILHGMILWMAPAGRWVT